MLVIMVWEKDIFTLSLPPAFFTAKNVAADISEKLCDSVATKLEGKVLGTFSGKTAVALVVNRVAVGQEIYAVMVREKYNFGRSGKSQGIIF